MIKEYLAQPRGYDLESDVCESGLIFYHININRRQLALGAVVGGTQGTKAAYSSGSWEDTRSLAGTPLPHCGLQVNPVCTMGGLVWKILPSPCLFYSDILYQSGPPPSTMWSWGMSHYQDGGWLLLVTGTHHLLE